MQLSNVFNSQNCKHHGAESYPVSRCGISTKFHLSVGIHTEGKNLKRLNGRLRQAVFVRREWIIYRHGFTFIDSSVELTWRRRHTTYEDISSAAFIQTIWRWISVCVSVSEMEKKPSDDKSACMQIKQQRRITERARLTVLSWCTVLQMWRHILKVHDYTYITYECHFGFWPSFAYWQQCLCFSRIECTLT